MNNTRGYIDIHTHLLPGVDDGSRNMEETIQMLKLMLEQNTETVIATPHYIAGAKNTPPDQLRLIAEQVQQEAWKLNTNFKLLLGNELFYSESIIDALRSKEALTLAGSRYVLVEFGVKEEYRRMYRGLSDMVRAGYIPVIAHIERYQCLMRREDLIVELQELGCYLQINCSCLLGGWFSSEVKYYNKLCERNLIHLISSDCHDSKLRVPRMKSAAEALQKKNNSGLIDQLMIDNPLKIIENSYI